MVGIGPISFTFLKISVAKLVTLLSLGRSIYRSISYKTARVVRLTPPTEVTGDGKFYFSKIVVVSLYVDE